MVWLRVVEEYLVRALLRSPTFHSMVGGLHWRINGFKSDLLPHFKEELRNQAGLTAKQQQRMASGQKPPVEANNADHSSLEPGLLAYFLDELKKQSGKR